MKTGRAVLFAAGVLALCGCASVPGTTPEGHTITGARSGTMDDIVNTAVSGLQAEGALARLEGHVAIHISSGNKELDTRFAGALQGAFPNVASRADTVRREDLYQMTVRVYRERGDVVAITRVSNFEQKNVIDRTFVIRGIAASIVETLQYKTATIARNEFDAYLDAAFAGTGALVAEAAPVPPPPPPPPKELPAWLKPDITFEAALFNFPVLVGLSLAPQGFILDVPIVVFNFYFLIQIGPEEAGRVVFGYLLRYNDYFYIPVEIGGLEGSFGYAFGTGIMKLWPLFTIDNVPILAFTAVKLSLGPDSKYDFNNTLMVSLGIVYRMNFLQ